MERHIDLLRSTPPDGMGLWIIKAESLGDALGIVNSGPRVQDGMVSNSARIVEWQVHIGQSQLMDAFHPDGKHEES